MKKITTNGRSFGTAQSLTRQQLKNVLGGSAIPTTKAGITCLATECGKFGVETGWQQGTCSIGHSTLGDYCICSSSGSCKVA